MIVTADLHLKLGRINEYRFSIFDFLRGQNEQSTIVILGDLVDDKDRHPNELVNRVIGGLIELADNTDTIIFLAGNHDYHNNINNIIGGFLKYDSSGIIVVREPMVIDGSLYVPNMSKKEFETYIGGITRSGKINNYKNVFMHQPFIGAFHGHYKLTGGIDPKILDGCRVPVYSGDIHAPQKIGPVEYVGAPYHINFGDKYRPRILHIDEKTNKAKTIPTDFPKKELLEIEEKDIWSLEPNKNDQYKVRIISDRFLDPSKMNILIKAVRDRLGEQCIRVEFRTKKSIKRRKTIITLDDHKEVFGKYTNEMNIPNRMRKLGETILREVASEAEIH